MATYQAVIVRAQFQLEIYIRIKFVIQLTPPARGVRAKEYSRSFADSVYCEVHIQGILVRA